MFNTDVKVEYCLEKKYIPSTSSWIQLSEMQIL